ncbi:MAG: antibiotic biosynthesis monooxygenase [Syntrophobacteraceae bacterium]|nr:antibiotic biosynthesis monooxygenase [Syntrophobacteraceae bacterium]
MTIRVLIEREVEPGQEMKLQQLMMQLRSKAIHVKGYISGETLRALDNPNRFLAISNWNSVEDWRNWEKSPERQKLQEEIRKLLHGKESCTVYTRF